MPYTDPGAIVLRPQFNKLGPDTFLLRPRCREQCDKEEMVLELEEAWCEIRLCHVLAVRLRQVP